MTTPAKVTAPPGWRVETDGKRMAVEVKTKDFLAALDLVRAIGDVAEEMDHHPDLHVERWNHVRVVTWSHDAGGLTARDERLARRVSDLLRERGLLSGGS